MLRTASNAKASTLAVETLKNPPAFRFRKERISLAFSGQSESTKATSNSASVATRLVNGYSGQPRGVRLKPKLAHPRLIGFVTEQRWQGRVLSVGDNKFWARVYDMTAPQSSEIEEVELESGRGA